MFSKQIAGGCVASALSLAVLYGTAGPASAQTVLPATVPVPWGPDENLFRSWAHVVPGTTDTMRLAFSGLGTPDTLGGAKEWKLWYQVFDHSIGEYDTIRPLIQDGPGYSQTHPIDPVYIEPPTRQNPFVMSASPPITMSNGQLLVPFNYWALDGNNLEHENDTFTFHRGGVLIGTWTPDRSDIKWSLGLTSGLDFNTQSTRGEIEPSVTELSQPGRILMSIRGSNYNNTSLPGRSWRAVSNDYGQTWSPTEVMTYSDGTDFFSPSAMSRVIRNQHNQKTYWIGNIVDSNPDGNNPRYPLVIGEIDESNLGIIKSTVQTIATRDTSWESVLVQYSNFEVTESALTGEFVVSVPVDDVGGFLRNDYLVVTPSGLPAPSVFVPNPGQVAWDFRYEGDVLPTTAGSVAISDGTTSQFFTRAGTPLVTTDGDILNFAPQADGAGLIAHDAKHPFATGSSLLLDPAVGFTVEWRANLNSVDEPMDFAGALVQIANGTTGASLYSVGMADPNGALPGYVVNLGGLSNQPVAVPDGFHTYRLAVDGTFVNLYVDGVLVATDTSGGGTTTTFEMRVGDFTSIADADWDLDYLYAYDGGAVAPTPPLVGDLDGDGFVGIVDLNIVLGAWNQNVPPAFGPADPSGDGFVGIADLNIVLGNWNSSTPPGQASNVIPEPVSFALVTVGCCVLIGRRGLRWDVTLG
jgi:hypothetical protein